MLSSILTILKQIVDFIGKNPKFFLGIVVALMVVFTFKQCNTIKDLKYQAEVAEVDRQNEANRFKNNLDNLTDSVFYYKNENLYSKSVLRVKDGELEKYSKSLDSTKKRIQRLLNEIDQKEAEIQNIYVTKVSSDVTTNDVLTNVISDSLGNFSVGISDTNQLFAVKTMTWFKLVPDSTQMKLQLVDKFGINKPSQLKHKINFSLLLSQIQLPEGKTRILVEAVDKTGQSIPKTLLNIPFVNGVDFMDVSPQVIQPPEPKKVHRFGVMVGPSYGIYYVDKQFKPTWGIGATVGYKIF